jgi:hypothetical protein
MSIDGGTFVPGELWFFTSRRSLNRGSDSGRIKAGLLTIDTAEPVDLFDWVIVDVAAASILSFDSGVFTAISITRLSPFDWRPVFGLRFGETCFAVIYIAPLHPALDDSIVPSLNFTFS